MNARLALITFLDTDSGLRPDNTLPGPQPPLPGQPPGIWGGAPPWVSHPIAPGGQPPYPSQGPGFPTHPIAPGGSPGVPTHPIYNPPYPSTGPGFPTHPIAPGGPPLGIWGGAPPFVDTGFPSPQPPSPQPPGLAGQLPGSNPEGGWVWSFVPGYGWMWSWVPNPNPARPDNTLPPEGGEGTEPPVVNPYK